MVRKHTTWVWLDEDGDPCFVGWGAYDDKGRHPAKALWMARNRSKVAPLISWLRTLEVEPPRLAIVKEVVPLTKAEARSICDSHRKKQRKDGYELFDARDPDTRVGGGASRKVLADDMIIYGSVRDAANEYGVAASTVTRWCQQVDSGFDYL